MKHYLISFPVVAALSACGQMPFGKREPETPQPVISTEQTAPAVVAPVENTPTEPVPTQAAQTAEQLDKKTSKEERKAAAKPPASGGRVLGKTVASLGSATEPGFWLKTPLVSAEVEGTVKNPATGQTATVMLIPIDGAATAGSRMSLSALRLIGASLTDLTEVEVSVSG